MFIYNIYQRISHWFQKSLRRKFLLWSIAFWIVSISILSITFLLLGQNERLNTLRSRNIQIASSESRNIHSQISGIMSDTRIFSDYLESLGEDMDGQASALLALRMSSPQRYYAAYLFDEDSNLLIHLADSLSDLQDIDDYSEIVTRPAVDVDNEVLAASQKANETGSYVSSVQFIGLDKVPVIYIAEPVNYSSTVSRAIVVQIDLRDIRERINQNTVGDTGYTYVISHEGKLITHPNSAYVGLDSASKLDPVIEGYEGFTDYYNELTEEKVYAAYSPVGSPTNWGVVVEQDISEANEPVIRLSIIIGIIWLALAALGTGGILFMMRSFTQPIARLTRTTQEIGLTGKLAKTSMDERSDEIGQLSKSFDQMVERLQSMEGRLETIAAEERNRLARDLHDAVSQTLFSASLIAEVLPRMWEKNPEEAKKRLEEVRLLTRGALAEMRTLLLELRPSALIEADLPHLLSQLAESIGGRTRARIDVNIEGDCDSLPDEIKVALYRIAQEALNNAAKHAGATEVKVKLLCEQKKVTLGIRDNGQGFDIEAVPSDSLGLGIMRERATDVDAALSVQSSAGNGTEIMVVWSNLQGEDK